MNIQNRYPRLKVILCYTLFGGAIGSVWTSIVDTSIPVLISKNTDWIINFQGIQDWFALTLFYIVFGGIFGLLPSFCVGVAIAWDKFCIKHLKDYLTIFGLGLFASLPAGLLLIGNQFLSDKTWIVVIVAGGLSAVILAKFIVPKGTPKITQT